MVYRAPQWKVDFFYRFLENLGVSPAFAALLSLVLSLLFLVALAYLLDFTARRLIRLVIGKLIFKTASRWDNIFYEKGVFSSLSHLLPIIGLQLLTPPLLWNYPLLADNARILYRIAFVAVVVLFLLNAISALENLGTHENRKRTIAVSTFSQLIKVIAVIMGLLICISILLHIDIKTTLASLGVLSAIIILVFKDTILGFVSGVQLAATQSIKVGDWITLPTEKVDGTVVEVNLATAKICNFDMTISTVPTYALIASPVTNHEPISALKIRRIKRSIYINARSIRFLDAEALEALKSFHLVRDYIEARQFDIQAFNRAQQVDKHRLANGRNQTNIGVFRQYLLAYLKQYPDVAQDQTLMLRLLEPTSSGIPLEIYCFANTAEWLPYEAVQSDIFDHVLAAAAEFGLEVFQHPSGLDIKGLGQQ